MKERPTFIMYEGKKYLRGIHGVPDFYQYKTTKHDDWYWQEGSEKKDCKFLWWNSLETDSKKWK